MSLTLINGIDSGPANVTVAFSFDASRGNLNLESSDTATVQPVLTAWTERRRLSAPRRAAPRRALLAHQKALV